MLASDGSTLASWRQPRINSKKRALCIGFPTSNGVTSVTVHRSSGDNLRAGHKKVLSGSISCMKKSRRVGQCHSDQPWKAISGVDQWYAGLAPLHLDLPCLHRNSNHVLWSFTMEDLCMCSNRIHDTADCTMKAKSTALVPWALEANRMRLISSPGDNSIACLLVWDTAWSLKGFTKKWSTGMEQPILSANQWKTCHMDAAAVGPPAATSFKNSLTMRGVGVLTE